MAWPFDGKKEIEVGNQPAPGENKPPEKTPAELIAESLAGFKTELTARFDELGNRLNTVEQSVKRPEPVVEGNQPPSIFENEQAAMAGYIGPVYLRQMELEARVVLSEVKQEYVGAGFGDMWREFEKEIKAVLDGSPVAGADGKPIRGNPDYIRNTVDMIFGRAARQKGVRFKDQTFFLEGAGGDAGGGNSNQPNDGMSEKQRKIFQRMGIDPKEGAKTMGKLTFIN